MQNKLNNADQVKTAFILGRYPNPRFKKRINNEKKLGKVALICWDKGSTNNLDYFDEGVDTYPILIEGQMILRT